MIGAVSLNPYISGYQYTGGYARTRASAQNMQIQAGQQSSGATAGERAVSTGKSSSVQSLIGARGITVAGQASGTVSVHAGRAANPESPVQPVDAVSSVQPGRIGSTNYMIPFLRQGMDPAELAVRMRMQYTGTSAAEQSRGDSTRAAEEETVQLDLPGMSSEDTVQSELPGTESEKAAEAGLPGQSSQADGIDTESEKDMPKIAGLGTESAQETTEEAECKTCKERKYQDGSDDPGVSFKTPTHIGPDQSASAVRGHELEHVVRERAKAQSEGRRVISQSVTMQTGICPECGRVYTAGGVTRTTTAAQTKQPETQKDPRWILASDI